MTSSKKTKLVEVVDNDSGSRYYAADDIDRMVKELDVAMNGSMAAQQPLFIDVLDQALSLVKEYGTPPVENHVLLPQDGEIYQHYKGGNYVVLGRALRESDQEPLICYQSAEYKPDGLGQQVTWVRTQREFCEKFKRVRMPKSIYLGQFFRTQLQKGEEHVRLDRLEMELIVRALHIYTLHFVQPE